MPFVRVASLSDLEPGQLIHKELGSLAVAVCNYQGKIFAIDGVCPHAGGPLGCGALNDRFITCPWHMWGFDCETGQSDISSTVKLDTYEVKVENGQVLVDIP